jgi:hypothetical protein
VTRAAANSRQLLWTANAATVRVPKKCIHFGISFLTSFRSSWHFKPLSVCLTSGCALSIASSRRASTTKEQEVRAGLRLDDKRLPGSTRSREGQILEAALHTVTLPSRMRAKACVSSALHHSRETSSSILVRDHPR